MVRNFIFLFFILFAFSALGQATVAGQITDDAKSAVTGATLILKDTDGAIAAFAISGEKGLYTIQAAKAGDFTLEVNFLGFKKQAVAVTLKPNAQQEINFTLEPSAEELKEIKIDYEQPVKLRGDTLIFDAKALRTGTEVVVEDLLKNIPGIVIKKDGTILYNDKPVERVMIEGDDLLSRGYALLTKNMPEKPLDKVEVLQNYSRNKLLKGIEESSAVALNLTLQEDYKNLWFGSALGGYGNKERYLALANIMNFGKKHKTFVTGSSTNAGYDKTGNPDNISSGTDMETTGQGQRATKLMALGYKTPRLDEERTRFNNAHSGTISSVLPVGSKAKLKLTGFAMADRRTAFQESLSVINVPGTSFTNFEQNNVRDKIFRGYSTAVFSYDISASRMLEASLSLTAGRNDFANRYTFNGERTLENLATKNLRIDQKVTYTTKYNNDTALLLKSHFFTEQFPQEYSIDRYLLGDLFQGSFSGITNSIGSRKLYGGFEATLKTKQKDGSLLEVDAGIDHNRDTFDTRFSLLSDTGLITPGAFQMDNTISVTDVYARSGYTLKWKKFSFGANVAAHQLFNLIERANGDQMTQNPFFVNPALTASWQVTPDNSFSAGYRYNFCNLSSLQVSDSYLLTSSRSFSKGLGYFDQLQISVAYLAFNGRHYLNRYQYSARAELSQQAQTVAYRTQLEQNSSLSAAFLRNGGSRASFTAGGHYIIKPLQGTLRANTNLARMIYYNFVNDSGLRKNILYTETASLGWSSNFKHAFNFDISTELSFSQVKSDFTFKNTARTSEANLKYAPGEKVSLKFKAQHYYFGGAGNSKSCFFGDVSGSYIFGKKKQFTAGADCRNIFDNSHFTTFSVNDTGYYTSSYQLLPRYILLTLDVRF